MMVRSGIKIFFTTISFSFVVFFSTLLFAANDNQPAMRPAPIETNASTQTNTAITSTNRSTGINTHTGHKKNAPSSVELMMQRQTANTSQSLPATEIQPGETISVHRLNEPRRGASMKEVQHELGQPLSTLHAVGKPPITRWIYNDRIVYFEYSSVIDAVAR